MTTLTLRVAHLYPRLMNIYGDRGNIMCLRHRTEARGIGFELTELSLGDRFDPGAYDLVFAGGAQDREQRGVADDLLATKAPAIREAVEDGVVLLAVCGAYQLFGRFYRESSGVELAGAALFDLHTEHPGDGVARLTGNIVAEWTREPSPPAPLPLGERGDAPSPPASLPRGERGAPSPPAALPRGERGALGTIVGFENHGGRTHLGPGARPLARVVSGHGNNGTDGTEGAIYRNAYGTYIHGSLLPKNPALADHLIALALRRVHGDVALALVDDRLEQRAHASALRLKP
jgi:CobQ-like glutamine amidotransferase family enzyme